MSWNIFKRVAELEKQVKDLKDFTHQHSQWNGQLERLKQIDNELLIRAVELKAFSADQAREAKRLYHREWRAKNKLIEDARERKNAYARAYYARTKGAKK
jgi:hypothetical protein